MFLGQLLYFEKEIDRVLLSSPYQSLLDIEYAGVDTVFLTNLKNLKSKNEALLQLKERFISGYEEVLISNNLFTALDFWKNITSPVFKLTPAVASSEFQHSIKLWLDNGGDLKVLRKEVLSSGNLVNEEQDFAIYYGLHVISKINKFVIEKENETEVLFEKFDLEKETASTELTDLPQILVVGPYDLQPLLLNINCLFIGNNENLTTLKEEVLKVLQNNPSISLVLVDSVNKNIIEQIPKDNLLISEISFENEVEDNFFDALVKKTLGIKLT